MLVNGCTQLAIRKHLNVSREMLEFDGKGPRWQLYEWSTTAPALQGRQFVVIRMEGYNEFDDDPDMCQFEQAVTHGTQTEWHDSTLVTLKLNNDEARLSESSWMSATLVWRRRGIRQTAIVFSTYHHP